MMRSSRADRRPRSLDDVGALRARGRRVDAHVLDDRQRLDGEPGAFEHRAQLIERRLGYDIVSSEDLKDPGRKLGESLIGTLSGTPTQKSTNDEKQTA